MTISTFFVSDAAVRNLKRWAERRVGRVHSAHLSEGVAAALGFKTHAALRAALKRHATVEAKKPSNARLIARLRELGYDVPVDLHALPEFEQSYTPFGNYPLRKQRSVRWTAWRNLMVAAINAGLEQRLFGLSPGEDWWPGADPKSNGGERGTYCFTFDGDLPAVASVSAISGDELAIYVLLDPCNAQVEAAFNDGLDDGAACAHGWLERQLGTWVHDDGKAFSCKRAVQARVAAAKVEPCGYADQGSFIL